MARRVIDQLLRGLVFVTLGAFFRDVDIVGRERIPSGRPILIVSNHFNGFIDPVVLVKVFDRLPRFLAKSSLWKIRGLAPLCALAGMIPIHRPGDGDVRDNVSMFERCHDVLAAGDIVGIFPEGTTHDVPSVQAVRTGAARIALGAVEAGAPDLVIVPVGLTFDDKLVLRSRVMAQVGRPIEVRAFVDRLGAAGGDADTASRAAVQQLTAEIGRGMRAVAPDYADAPQARALGRAGEIAVRTDRTPGDTYVRLGAREAIARKLARGSAEQRDEVINALGRYQLDLDLLGLRDHLLVPGFGPRQLMRQTILRTLALVVLAVPVLAGLVWNIIPYVLTRLAGHWIARPTTKGSVRLSVALVVFPLMWTIVVLLDPFSGTLPTLTVLVMAPLLGLLAVRMLETLVRTVRAWQGVNGLRARSSLIDEVMHRRRQLTDAIDEVISG